MRGFLKKRKSKLNLRADGPFEVLEKIMTMPIELNSQEIMEFLPPLMWQT